jgi:transglutaminase-like putative cysteine protease
MLDTTYSRPGVDWVDTVDLLPGTPGTVQTLKAMAELVRRDAQNPEVRDEALAIVAGVPGHDFRGEIDNCFHFVQHHITYRRDPVEQERVQDTLRTIKVFPTADCDDKCVCLASLLGSLGHKCRFKVIGKNPSHYSHVYLEVLDKKRGWLPLDPTPEQAPSGWEARGYHAAVYEIYPPETDYLPIVLGGLGLLAWWVLR